MLPIPLSAGALSISVSLPTDWKLQNKKKNPLKKGIILDYLTAEASTFNDAPVAAVFF